MSMEVKVDIIRKKVRKRGEIPTHISRLLGLCHTTLDDHRRSSAITSGHWRSSAIIGDHRRSLAIIGGHRRSSAINGGYWRSSAVTSDHRQSSVMISCHWRSSGVIGGHWRSTAVIGDHRRILEHVKGSAPLKYTSSVVVSLSRWNVYYCIG